MTRSAARSRGDRSTKITLDSARDVRRFFEALVRSHLARGPALSHTLPDGHGEPMLVALTLTACGYALRGGPVRMQVNSDHRPTQEYMNHLLGIIKNEVTEDGPSVIVGGGRIGSMLLDFGQRKGFDDVLIKRGALIPADHPGPVYVCTQTEDLAAVIAACPEEKKDDLVFLQDGMLEPLFQRNGIYGPTQAALYLAVVRAGSRPVDGVTSENPEGLTTVSGKWAGAFAMRMEAGEMSCHVKMDRDGRRSVLEKLVFTSAYNLVGACYGGITVGEVATKHPTEVSLLPARRAASTVPD